MHSGGAFGGYPELSRMIGPPAFQETLMDV